jgi:hypothetical protein
VKELLAVSSPSTTRTPATLLAVGGVKVHLQELADQGTAQPQLAPRCSIPPPATEGRTCPVRGLSMQQAIALLMAKVGADPSKDRSFFTSQVPQLGAETSWDLAEQAVALYGKDMTAQVRAPHPCPQRNPLQLQPPVEYYTAALFALVSESVGQSVMFHVDSAPHQQSML